MRQPDDNRIEALRAGVPALLSWYDQHRRPLPFRENPTPYRVWVSEIMLQQTRIEAAMPYFERFMQELPTVAALAAANEEQLLKLWEGLGYYSRVRHLQKAARQVMEQYGGALPADYEALLSLCGVGEYTAGAIASIAYGLPVPAVDGNVLRVLSRLLCCREDVLALPTRRALSAVAWRLVPEDRPGAFNEAVMELGETVCLPNTEPHCEQCPLYALCDARAAGEAAALPVRLPKTRRRTEQRTVLVALTNEPSPRVLLHRRETRGLLAGLWELPNAEGTLTAAALADRFSLTALDSEQLPEGRHVFSHLEWHMTGVRLTVTARPLPEDYVWADAAALSARYALPSAFRTYARLLPRWMPGTAAKEESR